MDLLNKTKDLCRLYGIIPARSKGQNFLIKEEIYDQIVEAADLQKDDIVLEVGPGLGFLTAKLAKSVKQVVAVELDNKLAGALKAGLIAQKVGNVEVVNQSILEFPISNFQFPIKSQISNDKFQINDKNPCLPTGRHNPMELCVMRYALRDYKIVANLPYNITSYFLRKFLESENKPKMMVLMLQKEVAERIVARPPKMSLLGISVQFYADAEIVMNVPRNNFWPIPAVDSAVVRFTPPSQAEGKTHPNPPFQKGRENSAPPFQGGVRLARRSLGGGGGGWVNEKDFFRLVKFGFSAKRKMLKNNLAGGFRIDDKEVEKKLILANISPTARAQELSLEDWYQLFGLFY